ncbi:MAG: NUDIX hydrolase [Clostridia bacterium]|nr:NUDIX hydrolase [Clostridia bacterium]
MRFKEKTVKSEVIYKGRIITVKKDDIVLPNGNSAIREVVHHSGGSAILCEMDGKILMVKQFRYPYAEELWEIPAGKLNEGESPELTAIRELEEEGGIKAKRVEKLFEIYPTPAYNDEIIRIYQAFDLEKTQKHLDEDEFLTSEWIEKEKLKDMIYSGEIKDAKTVIALLAVLDK